jgi:hypothetical protein
MLYQPLATQILPSGGALQLPGAATLPLPLGRCCTFQERKFGWHFDEIHQMVPISRQISVKPKAFGSEKRLKRA